MAKKTVQYSEAFKLEVVSRLESGEVGSMAEVAAKFGIAGHATVRRWILKYGKNHLLPKVVRVEKPNEKNVVREQKHEIDRLKKALADSHMETVLYQSWFEIACRETGVEDVDAFKKKLEERLSI